MGLEQVVFDKAEKAERIEKERQQLLDTIQKCKNDLEGCAEDRRDELKQTIKNCQEKLDALDKSEDESDQK